MLHSSTYLLPTFQEYYTSSQFLFGGLSRTQELPHLSRRKTVEMPVDHYWESLGVEISRHTFPSSHHFAWMAWNPSSHSPEKALKATLAYLFLPRGLQKMFFI